MVTKRLNSKPKILFGNKPTRQLTLDNLFKESPKIPNETAPVPSRQIFITGLSSEASDDELVLRIDFKLLPSKFMFSKIKADLHFAEETVKSVLLDVWHSFDLTDEFQLRATFDASEISTGQYPFKVELYEPSSHVEKHPYTKKEATIQYVREPKESRLRRIPTVKKIEGQGLAIVSESEKDLYHEIEEAQKREITSNRDEW